ncbi:MAG: hypothetical protein ABID35_01680, partial [Candidatus Margulisiibacteriota bacterium]
LGLLSSDVAGVTFMHAEAIVKYIEDFSGFENDIIGEPNKVKALEVFAEFGDMLNMSANLTGYTATLTYPTASGTKTVTLSEDSFTMGASIKASEGEMGPPPGMKMVRLDAWNPETRVTDVTNGTATLTLKDANGATVDTETIEIPDIDLSAASVSLNVPNQVWVDQISNMTKFSVNSTPTMSWTTSALPTAPSGYRLAYAINCIKGQVEKFPGGGVGFMANWGSQDSRVYDSWEKRNFIPATAGETFSFTLPATLSEAGIYEFGVGVVAINIKTGFPAAEGPHAGGIFIVGELADAIPAGEALDEFQNDFVEVDIASQTFTLEGNVSANILADDRFTSGTLKVGLVKASFDKNTGIFSQTLVDVTPVTLTDVGQTYKTFSLEFSGSVFGTSYGHYEIILWNDADAGGDLDEFEFRERAIKDIEHQPYGTRTYWPPIGDNEGGGADLVDSQGDFDVKLWNDSF